MWGGPGRPYNPGFEPGSGGLEAGRDTNHYIHRPPHLPRTGRGRGGTCQMQERTYAVQVRCTKVRMQYRKDAKQDGCRTGRKHVMSDAGHAGHMQCRVDARQNRCLVVGV